MLAEGFEFQIGCGIMRKTFEVSVEKEQLIFSAAHFITFADNICESIHGHNYRVRCHVSGDLEQNSYVVDFIALRDHLLKLTSQWDHHVLLPTKHETIRVEVEENEVVARFENRRWVFPADDCALLEIDNTTAARLAELIAADVVDGLLNANQVSWKKLSVGVDENEGQWAFCHLENDGVS